MFTSAPNTIVLSSSRAAHFSSVATLGSTTPSNAVRPLTATRTGLRKSNTDGDNSSVNALTPSVDTSTTFPRRTTSALPDGLFLGKMADAGRSTSVGANVPSKTWRSPLRSITK